jgi:hypothetical protein
MQTSSLKYARVEGNKLIVIPTKAGKSLFDNRGLSEGTDTFYGHEGPALVKTFRSNVKNFELKQCPAKNVASIYVYTANEEQFKIGFPCLVEVKEEAPKEPAK